MRHFFLFICLFVSQFATSQIQKTFWNWEVVDTTRIICTYDYVSFMVLRDANYKKHESFVLKIGNHISKYYSAKRFICDSLYYTTAAARTEYTRQTVKVLRQTAKVKNSEEEYDILNQAPGGSCIKIYRNHLTDSITVRDWLGGNHYVEYTEPDVSQQWELGNDTMYIMGYLCHVAKCFWRGRYYQAWYAEDIPISDGPYKFHGLPGLIMRIEDMNSENEWTISGIEISKDFIFLDKPFDDNQYVLSDRKTVLKNEWKKRIRLQQKINADMMAIGKVEAVQTNLPYDLIELDYK